MDFNFALVAPANGVAECEQCARCLPSIAAFARLGSGSLAFDLDCAPEAAGLPRGRRINHDKRAGEFADARDFFPCFEILRSLDGCEFPRLAVTEGAAAAASELMWRAAAHWARCFSGSAAG